MFAFSLPSSAHYLAGETELLLASVYQAVAQVFGEPGILAADSMVFVVPGSVQPLEVLADRFARNNVPILLGAGPLLLNPEEKATLFAALYEPLFDPFRLEQQKTDLHHVAIAANRDAQPLAYYLNLRRWVREIGFDALNSLFMMIEQTVGWVQRHGLWMCGVLIVGAALVGLTIRANGGRRAVLAGSILTSGLAGMLGQLVLVLMYQNTFGRLYQAMGVLFALYMVGLVIGSGLSTGRVRTQAHRAKALLGLRGLMAATSIVAAILASTGIMASLFLTVFLYALVFGLEYPVANRVYQEDLAGTRAAGILHAMDHLGASLATFVGATLLLPLTGPRALLFALAALHLIVLSALAPVLIRTSP